MINVYKKSKRTHALLKNRKERTLSTALLSDDIFIGTTLTQQELLQYNGHVEVLALRTPWTDDRPSKQYAGFLRAEGAAGEKRCKESYLQQRSMVRCMISLHTGQYTSIV